uniref:Metalloendopeptidase n=1 Tax=Fundulus heteroclitus TaxID=8078 RepID=A0A3Q2PUR6_FUNHE
MHFIQEKLFYCAFQKNAIMISAFVFLLFLSVATVSLSKPVDKDDDFETPMLLDDIAIPDLSSKNADPCTAHGCLWPKTGSHIFVPYEISKDYSSKEHAAILAALKGFHQSTCIRFIPRKPVDQDYIYFFSKTGCWSYLGRMKGQQTISLQKDGCLSPSTIQHEILHALGFNHEQVRSDRDEYVRILFENIEPGKEHNFDKKKTNNLGTPYDFKSIMEYANNDFSKNGKPTIVAIKNPKLKFGNAQKMSSNDIARVNKLYQCC